jgi:antitoxin ParD1/3/4
MDITLTPELEQLVSRRIESGKYTSANEVIGEALRLLDHSDAIQQYQLEELRREIAIGLAEADRGELAPLDVEAIKAEGRRRLIAEPKER